MEILDPRSMAMPVHDALNALRTEFEQDINRLKEQKNQAVELYTYLATWGMMRLKAEEKAIKKDGKKEVIKNFFDCLENLSKIHNLAGEQGLNTLKNLSPDEYLGLTGLGLSLAQEFSFWAAAVYYDITGAD